MGHFRVAGFKTSAAANARAAAGDSASIAHGKQGLPLLFVDSHTSFTRYSQLNKTAPYGDYNLDWTIGGLAKGEDLR